MLNHLFHLLFIMDFDIGNIENIGNIEIGELILGQNCYFPVGCNGLFDPRLVFKNDALCNEPASQPVEFSKMQLCQRAPTQETSAATTRKRAPKKETPVDIKRTVKYREHREKNNASAARSREAHAKHEKTKINILECLNIEKAQLNNKIVELWDELMLLKKQIMDENVMYVRN